MGSNAGSVGDRVVARLGAPLRPRRPVVKKPVVKKPTRIGGPRKVALPPRTTAVPSMKVKPKVQMTRERQKVEKRPKGLPRKKKVTRPKKKFMERGPQAVIAHAARQGRKVRVRYTKVTTGETVERVLEPYAYRYEKSSMGSGRWKFLYGYHGSHGSIEKYLVRNIHTATLTRTYYKPRWVVEIR